MTVSLVALHCLFVARWWVEITKLGVRYKRIPRCWRLSEITLSFLSLRKFFVNVSFPFTTHCAGVCIKSITRNHSVQPSRTSAAAAAMSIFLYYLLFRVNVLLSLHVLSFVYVGMFFRWRDAEKMCMFLRLKSDWKSENLSPCRAFFRYRCSQGAL